MNELILVRTLEDNENHIPRPANQNGLLKLYVFQNIIEYPKGHLNSKNIGSIFLCKCLPSLVRVLKVPNHILGAGAYLNLQRNFPQGIVLVQNDHTAVVDSESSLRRYL